MPHSLRAKLSGLRYKGILEDKDYKRLCHALDLEKAEQEPCDDAISRPSVIKFEGTNMACMGGDEIMKEFENSPQQTVGHWIVHSDGGIWIIKYYECSKCGKVHDTHSDYCPNCGACMKDGRTLDEFIEDSKESEDKE